MDLSFTGRHDQKVDSKRRMSIPAEFRAVLEDGDPQFRATGIARMKLVYGPHLDGHIQAYTIGEFDSIARRIHKSMKQGTKAQKYTAWLILGHSVTIDVDRDGRIVLPQERREQIGLGAMARLYGMGPHFEIWNAEDSDEAFSDVGDWLAEMGDGFDPLSLVPDEAGDVEDV